MKVVESPMSMQLLIVVNQWGMRFHSPERGDFTFEPCPIARIPYSASVGRTRKQAEYLAAQLMMSLPIEDEDCSIWREFKVCAGVKSEPSV